MPRARVGPGKISVAEDVSTGMLLERISKNMKGERYAASLQVNPASAFQDGSFRYKKMGNVWVLLACPKGIRQRGGQCRIRGKNAQVVQHVLYKRWRTALKRFERGDLQKTWADHQKKLKAVRKK